MAGQGGSHGDPPERFEKGRRTIGLFLAPAVFLIFFLLPLDMDETQQKLAAALLFVVVLWISEAIPIPIGGLLGIVLIVLIGVAPVDDVLAPFGSSTIFVFIGAFIIAQAMLKHGLARRFAFRVLSLPGVGKSTQRTILAFGASVGGLLTPVGSPPNLIGRGLIEEATGERISFLEWMLAALPICALMFVALAAILLLLNRPEVRRLEGVEEYVASERQKLGRLSRKEKNTLIAFA